MQFCSMNSMSVESTELMRPMAPSVKKPMGRRRRCAPRRIRMSAKTMKPAADCSRSAAYCSPHWTATQAKSASPAQRQPAGVTVFAMKPVMRKKAMTIGALAKKAFKKAAAKASRSRPR